MWIRAFCSYPFTRVRVTCEGNVSMCCFMREMPLKPVKEAYIGNVLESTFDEVWFGSLAEEIRTTTAEGNLHEKCQCPGCPYLSMNKPYPIQDIVYNEYPTFLEIDLPNTHCNVGGLKPHPVDSPACIMCERSAPHFRPENSERFYEVLQRIAHLLPNLQQIHIQGIAEPFYQTNQDEYMLFDILDCLNFDQFKDQILLSLTTNAILMKEKVRREYLKRVPRSITTVSIDAATPETYKKIRILDCFDKVLENLYAFSSSRNVDQQFLQIHNNINTVNVGEVVGMVQIAHKANVNCLEFNATDGFNYKILVNRENCGIFARAHADIVEECNRLGVEYLFIRPLDLGMMENLVQLTL